MLQAPKPPNQSDRLEEEQIARMVSEGGRDLPEMPRKREPLMVYVPTLLMRLHEAGILK